MNRLATLALATTALTMAGCAATQQAPAPANPPLADGLAAGFAQPPATARPRVWWHWMNGNITQDGIAKDLAWMADVGIGGVQTFDVNLGTPQIVAKRLAYMTPEWKDAFAFAAAETRRRGLELTIAASPGWSETGGPWVRPEQGMKKLVWSQALLRGGVPFAARLPAPPTRTGPYQDAHPEPEFGAPENPPEPPRAAGRIAVVAIPLANPPLPLPAALYADRRTASSASLSDADLESGLDVKLDAQRSGALALRYPRAVTVRSAHVFFPDLKKPFRGMPIVASLEADRDGTWIRVAEVPLSSVPTSVAFTPVTARAFRLRLAAAPEVDASQFGGAPGAIAIDIFAFGKLPQVRLTDFRLASEPVVDQTQEKAGYDVPLNYDAIASNDPAPAGVAPGQVIDLTDRIGPDGRLRWTPPAGSDWRVLSFGWSLTGTTNHPAPPEATGLEVDKYDAGAVRDYLEHYLATYSSIPGAQNVDALLTDSIEVGKSNWTPAMEAEFANRRGYALRPWLPALAGFVIGSRADTEKFLYDWRRTLAELLADNHYGTLAAVAHEHGLKVYGEALEDKRPVLGDDLAMRSHADVPMAALWTWQKGDSVRTTLLGDMKGAASVAHVYGKPYVAAESMTSVNAPWAFAPRDLKTFIDLEFASGINRPVIHTSVHQPTDDKQPGLSLLIFGQYFNRHESWAGMARPWVDYMARSAYLLQQGRYQGDIAWFVGEEAPVTAQFANAVPAGLPTHYGYDFVNAAMLSDALAIDGHELVSKGGTRYAALHLGESSRLMTLATLRRVAEIARAGVLVTGTMPEASRSLADDKAAFAAVAAQIRALPNVTASSEPEAALRASGLVSDFAWQGSHADDTVLFLHRRTDDAEIYFLTNRDDRASTGVARFRVSGRQPEWWDAITGTSRPLTYRQEDGVIAVPLDLVPHDAGFIVFRTLATANAQTVTPARKTVIPTGFAPWTVTFQPGRGAPASMTMPTLSPLDKSDLPGVRYFSGVATYTSAFDLRTRPGGSLWLDLGTVGDVAEVYINGTKAGTAWFAPNRVDIGRWARAGSNRIEVRVANLWVNRLIGDQQPGATKVAFVAAPTYLPSAPLRPSGLIGPVTLYASR